MKANIKGLTIVTLLILAGCFSCTKNTNNSDDEDTPCENSPHECILGEWKLLNVTNLFTPTGPRTYDFTKNNIIYDFKTNGVLEISGDLKDIDMYQGLDPGKLSYSIVTEEEAIEHAGLPTFRLKISTVYFTYSISSKKLIIDGRALDGPIINLVRVNN